MQRLEFFCQGPQSLLATNFVPVKNSSRQQSPTGSFHSCIWRSQHKEVIEVCTPAGNESSVTAPSWAAPAGTRAGCGTTAGFRCLHKSPLFYFQPRHRVAPRWPIASHDHHGTFHWEISFGPNWYRMLFTETALCSLLSPLLHPSHGEWAPIVPSLRPVSSLHSISSRRVPPFPSGVRRPYLTVLLLLLSWWERHLHCLPFSVPTSL